MENNATQISLPLTQAGVIKFLEGHWVEGIGPAYARKLVETFGTDAIPILKEYPERVLELPGFGPTRVYKASKSLNELKYPADVLAFLSSCGISDMYITKLFGKYRKRTAEIILTDPYSTIEDVWRLSFHTADKIGRALDIPADDPRRLKGALLTAVKQYAEQGHLFATPQEAAEGASRLTGIPSKQILPFIPQLAEERRVVESHGGVYLPVFYNAERAAAERLSALANTPHKTYTIDDIPARNDDSITYSHLQREAILKALNSPVMVLTGGPGSGKTTVLRGVIETLEKSGKKIVLAAPTGRAAKRMTTLTGRQASTIHRLLGYREGQGWLHRTIDADTIIIDEGSMMEQVLFDHILQSVRPGTGIILVGDADQLPAIGAGNVLKDLIESDTIPVAQLTENFRQHAGSMIDAGARSIIAGEIPPSLPDSDFIIIPEDTVKQIHTRILTLIKTELPDKYGILSSEIQVVTPQQVGPLGAKQLNTDIQAEINPIGPDIKRGATIFRLGDPVMQTANSSQRKVYNGEIGHIVNVDTAALNITVRYTDGRESIYQRNELSELSLAYATTVHKLQGSEVKYMIFPITMTHRPMLYRNLIYTGVSRATKLCVLVGEPEALSYAIANTPYTDRHSNFGLRLQKYHRHGKSEDNKNLQTCNSTEL